MFIEQLKGLVLSPEQVSRHQEQADEQITNKLQLLQTLETERSQVRSEMEKVYRLYLDDRISGQLFAERNTPLEERFRQLDDEVPRLQADVDILRLQVASSDEVLAEARDLYARWPSLSFAERRQIVEAITDRILVADNEIMVNLAYLPLPQSFPMTGLKGAAKSSHTVRDSWPRRARSALESAVTPTPARW